MYIGTHIDTSEIYLGTYRQERKKNRRKKYRDNQRCSRGASETVRDDQRWLERVRDDQRWLETVRDE